MSEPQPELQPLVESGERPVTTVTAMATEAFGEYTLIARLGKGGMAEVFLALASGPASFRKLFVIKRLHRHMQDEGPLVAMFLDEARLAARLTHDNIVQTYQVGEIAGAHFMAMEYLEGQSLDRVSKAAVKAGAPLPPVIAARIVSETLGALHYAHEAVDIDGTQLDVVHRDVSPQNVFVRYDGAVKLLDFGIAKAATQESATRTGLIKGKFSYIAPEQAKGAHVDRRADLWSMGIVLWESLTGKRLFKSINEAATLNETLTAIVPRVAEIVPDVPEELERVVARALRRNPNERYQTAAEMKEDIDAWLSGQTTAAGRNDLAAYMQRTFGDVIVEHRRVIRACVAVATGGAAAKASPSGQHVLVTSGGTPISGVAAIGSHGAGDNTAAGATLLSRPNAVSAAGPAPQPARQPSNAVAKVAIVLAAVAIAAAVGIVARSYLSTPPSTVVEVAPDRPREDPARPEGARHLASDDSPAPNRDVAPSPDPPSAPASVSASDAGAISGQASSVDSRANRATERARDRERERRRADAPPSGGPAGPVATPPPTSPPPAAEEFGYLSIDAVPWATVSLGGRRLGNTPLFRVRLPVGAHVLTLTNPESGMSIRYNVTIQPGRTTARRVALR